MSWWLEQQNVPSQQGTVSKWARREVVGWRAGRLGRKANQVAKKRLGDFFFNG